MSFEFLVDPSGQVVLVGGSSKAFPSVSVFSYSGDTTTDLFEQTESGNVDDLDKPVHGLGTRNDRFRALGKLTDDAEAQADQQ